MIEPTDLPLWLIQDPGAGDSSNTLVIGLRSAGSVRKVPLLH